MMERLDDGATLRIAQVAPLFVPVPPVRYGGTERVISELTEELVRRGHQVTLFAAGGSTTSARLCAGSPLPLWELESHERLPYQIAQIEEVATASDEFDVIHWHLEHVHWLVSSRLRCASVTTLHGRLDSFSAAPFFAQHHHEALVSISEAQRRPLAGLGLNWVANIHHGLDLARTYCLGDGEGGYLAFVGRSSPEKGMATAIRVALRAGLPIKIAARVGFGDVGYHESEIVPLLQHPLVEWLGELADRDKKALLESAIALLMPIGWDEPFGLSFIESLAAGTPIITRRKGALPELMRHGEHGYFAETEDEMVEACLAVRGIDRLRCRQWALEQFSTARMTDAYERAYRRVLIQASREEDAARSLTG